MANRLLAKVMQDSTTEYPENVNSVTTMDCHSALQCKVCTVLGSVAQIHLRPTVSSDFGANLDSAANEPVPVARAVVVVIGVAVAAVIGAD
jgi:hypothetical protein